MLLPLPCSTTIRRLISSMPCTFGFNEESFESIKWTLASLDLDLRRGSLVLDETSISKSLNFDAQKLRFEGFADYGLDDINEDPKAATDQLADHCLVFIFRPYRSSWVQPIAVFATKGLAPGHIISRLLLKAIVALETIGARVNSVTCDGAQTNKTAWADCGISETRDENGEISCSMKHPTAKEPGVRIWFLQDVPHLYKCIRSFIYSRRTLFEAKRKITKKQKATDAVVTESQVQLKRNTPENQKKPMLSLRNHIRLNYLVHSPLRNSSVKKFRYPITLFTNFDVNEDIFLYYSSMGERSATRISCCFSTPRLTQRGWNGNSF